MKKIVSLILAGCMLLALCACGAAAEPETEAEAVEASGAAAAAEPAADTTASAETASSGEASASGGAGAVPEHAEPIEIDIPEGASYLAFTGDMHGETENYRVWAEDILAVYGDSLTMLGYSGDICDKNWEEDVYAEFSSMLEELVPGRYNVTTGNQEFKSGAPGAAWDDLGEGYTRIGEAASTEDYLVYDFGAAGENMGFTQEDIDALDAYLAAAPEDVPIFVLSHFPLHLSMATETHSIPGGDSRVSENNAAVIEVLNNYPNVIFLWGHNHTFQDPRYGTIRAAGSMFTYDYANPTDKVEINFTYANYGSFCRGDSYGIMAEVLRTDAGVQVSLNYIDTNVPMDTMDSAVITVAADGTVTSEVTDGTGIDTAEILAMSGYADDPNFAAEF